MLLPVPNHCSSQNNACPQARNDRQPANPAGLELELITVSQTASEHGSESYSIPLVAAPGRVNGFAGQALQAIPKADIFEPPQRVDAGLRPGAPIVRIERREERPRKNNEARIQSTMRSPFTHLVRTTTLPPMTGQIVSRYRYN